MKAFALLLVVSVALAADTKAKDQKTSKRQVDFGYGSGQVNSYSFGTGGSTVYRGSANSPAISSYGVISGGAPNNFGYSAGNSLGYSAGNTFGHSAGASNTLGYSTGNTLYSTGNTLYSTGNTYGLSAGPNLGYSTGSGLGYSAGSTYRPSLGDFAGPANIFIHQQQPAHHVVHTVERQIAVPHTVHVDRPFPVAVERKVPVLVEKPVPYPVEHKVPYAVPVDRPVPVVVERQVPVAVDRPYPVAVEKQVQVPYPVEKTITIERQVPIAVQSSYSHGFAQGPIAYSYSAPASYGFSSNGLSDHSGLTRLRSGFSADSSFIGQSGAGASSASADFGKSSYGSGFGKALFPHTGASSVAGPFPGPTGSNPSGSGRPVGSNSGSNAAQGSFGSSFGGVQAQPAIFLKSFESDGNGATFVFDKSIRLSRDSDKKNKQKN